MKFVNRYILIISLIALVLGAFLASNSNEDCPHGSVSANGVAWCK